MDINGTNTRESHPKCCQIVNFFLMGVIIVKAERFTSFTSQPQISPKFCLQHNMTLNDVTLLHCASLCVESNVCRVVAYKPPTRTCMGCQYFMDSNYPEKGYDDTIDVPTEIPADSILFTPDATNYEYIGCYADCMLVHSHTSPCEALALPQALGMDVGMTIEYCFGHCQQYGTCSRYFGTQSERWCFCGQAFDKFGLTNRCTTPCHGNISQMCGGAFAKSVYEIIVED